mmetsp:Transcript_97336/g.275101  ORF Transcript_97336/g.275101 Transcript_97336/m.275101 type:complete len:220 (-) Transcript_97336:353-1012(-)
MVLERQTMSSCGLALRRRYIARCASMARAVQWSTALRLCTSSATTCGCCGAPRPAAASLLPSAARGAPVTSSCCKARKATGPSFETPLCTRSLARSAGRRPTSLSSSWPSPTLADQGGTSAFTCSSRRSPPPGSGVAKTAGRNPCCCSTAGLRRLRCLGLSGRLAPPPSTSRSRRHRFWTGGERPPRARLPRPTPLLAWRASWGQHWAWTGLIGCQSSS